MPPRAVLLDLYDTLVDGDWQGWRTQLSALTGINEETLGMAYQLTREERSSRRRKPSAARSASTTTHGRRSPPSGNVGIAPRW